MMYSQPQFWLLFLGTFIRFVDSRTLADMVCEINPKKCETYRTTNPVIHHTPSEVTIQEKASFGGPSKEELFRWANYESTQPGTGLHPDVGPNYGPGLGDISVNTGLGIQSPIGGLGIQRNFGVSFGGSGMSGGQPFGFGNGYQRTVGAAPWAWP